MVKLVGGGSVIYGLPRLVVEQPLALPGFAKYTCTFTQYPTILSSWIEIRVSTCLHPTALNILEKPSASDDEVPNLTFP